MEDKGNDEEDWKIFNILCGPITDTTVKTINFNFLSNFTLKSLIYIFEYNLLILSKYL